MSKIISCVNLKGGVGKTALAVNFAAYCGAYRDMRTLLVDLDPQTNATFSSIGYEAWERHAASNGTIADLLLPRHSSAEGRERTPAEVIAKDVFRNVDLVPSHLDLFTIDLELGGATGRERKLKLKLEDTVDDYDIVICDCPPNLTIPTQNALTMSTHYIVPVSPDFLSAVGVGLLLNRIDEFSRDIEHDIELAGIVVCRYGRPAWHREETVDTLASKFEDKLLNTVIYEKVPVSEAAAMHKPVFVHAKNSSSAQEFEEVSEEILDRMGF